MLGSPSREVILGIRRWWSGPRDGLVSSPVVVLQPASKFLPAFRLSLSLPCVRVVREPSGPRAVRLLFLYCQHLSPCIPRQSKLQSGKPFGGRGRSLRRRDTPPVPAPVPAKVPEAQICDRTLRCARRAPRVPARTGPFAIPRAQLPIRHRGKPRPLPLRTRRRGASASPARQFSLPRALTAGALRGAAGAPPPPGNLHLRCARGSWRVDPRSTPEKWPGDTRS